MHSQKKTLQAPLRLGFALLCICHLLRSASKPQLFSSPKGSGNAWIDKQRNREKLDIRISTNAATSLNENITFYNHGRTPEQIVLTAKLASWAKTRNWKDAYALFTKEVSRHKDTVLFDAILNVARQCGKFREAQAVFFEMRKQKVTRSPVTYNIMVDVLGKCRKLEAALELWSEYKASECFPSEPKTILIAYAALGNAAAKAGNVSMSLSMLEEVKQSGVVQPNEVLYGTALDACKQIGDRQTALFLLEEIRNSGLKTNTVMYASAIAAHRGAPLRVLNTLLSDMEAEGVATNEYVVDAYVLAVLGTSPTGKGKLEAQIKKQMDIIDPERAAAISSALFDAQMKGIRFTMIMKLIMDEIWNL
eukprot:TRINITY_DN48606_c0_g1_i1.p1 TRINITY_DN48606_c0_g1~~TRINITY_DN48606_c0_g1_i1.p1  ORF type:complete len:363 (+),score=55.08 TRINITY_DN48606_c0_g1_i1:99-1187(+)